MAHWLKGLQKAAFVTSWHGHVFHITGPWYGESTGDWRNPLIKGQQYGALMFSVLIVWVNSWTNIIWIATAPACHHYDALFFFHIVKTSTDFSGLYFTNRDYVRSIYFNNMGLPVLRTAVTVLSLRWKILSIVECHVEIICVGALKVNTDKWNKIFYWPCSVNTMLWKILLAVNM